MSVAERQVKETLLHQGNVPFSPAPCALAMAFSSRSLKSNNDSLKPGVCFF